jgi:Zn finger protein HypA/HybF involved in hydrogenase expression
MHGIHIAKDLVSKAKEQGKVKKATIELGEIANITKDDLGKQLYNIADFNFDIIEKKALIRCMCGYEGAPEIVERQHDVVIFTCPICGLNPEVIEGDKIVLKCVEVD